MAKKMKLNTRKRLREHRARLIQGDTNAPPPRRGHSKRAPLPEYENKRAF